MSLGLKRGTVVLEPHRVEWELSAQHIIKALKETLKEDCVDAQHIGSTSIKNICAKPIIDIVVGVTDFDDILKHNNNLSKKGIIYRRKDQPEQHLYVCGNIDDDIITHHIHAVIYGKTNWYNYINIRDYLNAHEDRAKEYAKLKEYLAAKYPDDRSAYTAGKGELINDILRCAEEWASKRLL